MAGWKGVCINETHSSKREMGWNSDYFFHFFVVFLFFLVIVPCRKHKAQPSGIDGCYKSIEKDYGQPETNESVKRIHGTRY